MLESTSALGSTRIVNGLEDDDHAKSQEAKGRLARLSYGFKGALLAIPYASLAPTPCARAFGFGSATIRNRRSSVA